MLVTQHHSSREEGVKEPEAQLDVAQVMETKSLSLVTSAMTRKSKTEGERVSR